VDFPEYWFNVRPSNTEPLIRLRLEAVSREVAEQRTEEVVELLKGFA
jgi:phosphomannomutase